MITLSLRLHTHDLHNIERAQSFQTSILRDVKAIHQLATVVLVYIGPYFVQPNSMLRLYCTMVNMATQTKRFLLYYQTYFNDNNTMHALPVILYINTNKQCCQQQEDRVRVGNTSKVSETTHDNTEVVYKYVSCKDYVLNIINIV